MITLEIAKTYQKELEEKLCGLIRIPSVEGVGGRSAEAPFGLKTVEALEYVFETAREMGFETHSVDGYAGFVHWKGSEDTDYVGAVCHLDVVPQGDWEDAFEPQITEDSIIGRGSIDDKGPALAVLYAMKALKDSGYTPKTSIRLILGLDEESGMQCLKYYNKFYKAPKASFTADADFPVIYAEKGISTFEYHFDFKNLAHNPLLFAQAGAASNVIPGVCELKYLVNGVEKQENVQGKMGHASVPYMGVNAISKAMDLLKDQIEHPFVNFFKKYIGLETDGNSLGIACEDESGALTVNVGLLTLDTEKAVVTFDMRYPVTKNFEEIARQLQKVADENGIHLNILRDSKPLYRSKEHPLVKILLKSYQQVTGDTKTEPIAIGGGTYARAIDNCLAFGPVRPGDPCLCHQNGEFVYREALVHAIAIYAEALRLMSEEA